MRFLLIFLLASCASNETSKQWVEGCVFGSVNTLQHMVGQPVPHDLANSIGMQCKSVYGAYYE